MKFTEFEELNELNVGSATELQNTDVRADARTIIAKTRGMMQGRKIDANGSAIKAGGNQQNTNAFEPETSNNTTADNDAGIGQESMILKNTPGEVVYVTKGENGIFITIVNKQRVTKRTIALDDRGATLLKRYI